jgi:hypothetical protein
MKIKIEIEIDTEKDRDEIVDIIKFIKDTIASSGIPLNDKEKQLLGKRCI